MEEDGASEVLGNSMILLITVGGIALVLAVGLPLLSTSQGLAQAKSLGQDFASAAEDIESGEGQISIPLHVPGGFSLSSIFGGSSLGFERGTQGFLYGGSCDLRLDDWSENTFEFQDFCGTTNTSGDCELFAICLAVDKWQETHFVPEEYTVVGGVVSLDSTDGMFRISVLDMSNDNNVLGRGYFWTQNALEFKSGAATAALEGGGFYLGAPTRDPNLVNGTTLVILQGGGSSVGGGTRTLEVSYGDSIQFEAGARYISSSFKGERQVGWCFAVSPAVHECSGPVAQTTYDHGTLGHPFKVKLRFAEASLEL